MTGSSVRLIALLLGSVVLAGCQQGAQTEAPAATTPTAGGSDSSGGATGPVDDGIPRDANGNPLGTTVYFDYDRSTLLSEGRALLSQHAGYLKQFTSRSVLVEGHCDERGTREYNLALGERRANATKEFMMAEGASGGQIETVTYGEERPVDPGHDESAWSKNRRAELVYRR